ncbi:MAG: DNA mismatch repair protein MutS [Bacteroidia bacterium]
MKEKAGTGPKETPLMQQYNQLKAQHPGALLLFRVGDFYETFGEDAIKTSSILGIVLTRRANGAAADMELAGFPHHSLETYLPRLVKAGQRVAVCEQMEDPKATKTIVKRAVTELLTPGVVFSEKILEQRSNNYLACLHSAQGRSGIALVDVSTGAFYLAEGAHADMIRLLVDHQPAECLTARAQRNEPMPAGLEHAATQPIEDWVFGGDYGRELLQRHFQTPNLKGFGVDELELGIVAAGAIMHYLTEVHQSRLAHITRLSRIDAAHYVWMDRFTVRNLELVEPFHTGGTSLLHVIDRAKTPMGARLLRRWLLFPLRDLNRILARQQLVSALVNQADRRVELGEYLARVGDIERILSRLATYRVQPRELLHLKSVLQEIEPIRSCADLLLRDAQPDARRDTQRDSQPDAQRDTQRDSQRDVGWIASLPADPGVGTLVARFLSPDAPALSTKPGVIGEGVDAELDHLRTLSTGAKDFMQQMVDREIQQTGISSLKISFNQVFGFYLEVTHAHRDKVPDGWIRKQTLVNAERYITPELKEFEDQYLHAEESIASIEARLYRSLLDQLQSHIGLLQSIAVWLARCDALLSMATKAVEAGYACPVLDDSMVLDINGGRHPVIETLLPPGEPYVPHDIVLDSSDQQMMMITGPNMSGKSALLRQTALLVIMAQMGGYVPASAARVGLFDKIFTRVGASDNLSAGESTFMVEMLETASILNNISARSLILLDEIGRGTSTYDGISIAWSIAEYLHEHPSIHPRTLFATHYHELNDMADRFARIHNFHVAIAQQDGRLIFTRKLMPGGSEHSFGLHVARMAGVPQTVLRRADELLRQLEEERPDRQKRMKKRLGTAHQLGLFTPADPIWEEVKKMLRSTDVERTTPVEALFVLHEIKRRVDAAS